MNFIFMEQKVTTLSSLMRLGIIFKTLKSVVVEMSLCSSLLQRCISVWLSWIKLVPVNHCSCSRDQLFPETCENWRCNGFWDASYVLSTSNEPMLLTVQKKQRWRAYRPLPPSELEFSDTASHVQHTSSLSPAPDQFEVFRTDTRVTKPWTLRAKCSFWLIWWT